jgi:hypothetical protein
VVHTEIQMKGEQLQDEECWKEEESEVADGEDKSPGHVH